MARKNAQKPVQLQTEDVVGEGKQTPFPPKPPGIDRKVSFYKVQAIGMPIFVLLSILGLTRLLDTFPTSVSASGPSIGLKVDYPARLRDHTAEPMKIEVRNTSGEPLSGVEVSLDESYAKGMQDATITPDPDEVDAEGIVFKIDSLEAGRSRVFTLDYRGGTPGSYSGKVHVSVQGNAVAETSIRTFVFP